MSNSSTKSSTATKSCRFRHRRSVFDEDHPYLPVPAQKIKHFVEVFAPLFLGAFPKCELLNDLESIKCGVTPESFYLRVEREPLLLLLRRDSRVRHRVFHRSSPGFNILACAIRSSPGQGDGVPEAQLADGKERGLDQADKLLIINIFLAGCSSRQMCLQKPR